MLATVSASATLAFSSCKGTHTQPHHDSSTKDSNNHTVTAKQSAQSEHTHGTTQESHTNHTGISHRNHTAMAPPHLHQPLNASLPHQRRARLTVKVQILQQLQAGEGDVDGRPTVPHCTHTQSRSTTAHTEECAALCTRSTPHSVCVNVVEGCATAHIRDSV